MSKQEKNSKQKPITLDTTKLEMTIVGFGFIKPRLFHTVAHLRPSYFRHFGASKVFEAMASLFQQRGPAGLEQIDLIEAEAVRLGLEQMQFEEIVQKAAEHADITEATAQGAAEHIARWAMRDQLLEVAEKIEEIADTPEKSADDMASLAISTAQEIVSQVGATRIVSLAEAMDAEIERISNPSVRSRGFLTGLKDLDYHLGGIQRGEVFVIGGRPGMGKTQFLIGLALGLARQSLRGLLVTMEMPRDQYCMRMACCGARMNMKRVQQNALNSEQRRQYIEAAQELRNLGVTIVDEGAMTLPRLTSIAHRLRYEGGLDWIGIDYLGLMNHLPRRGESVNDQITRTSNGIKQLALSLNIPIFPLVQLNRDPEKRDNKRPRMSDIRDSGSIEQDADTILMLYREWVYADEERKQQMAGSRYDTAELLIVKRRNGETGTVEVACHRESCSFVDKDVMYGGSSGQGQFGQD